MTTEDEVAKLTATLAPVRKEARRVDRNYRRMMVFLHTDIAAGRISHRLAAKRMGIGLRDLAGLFKSLGLDNPWQSK